MCVYSACGDAFYDKWKDVPPYTPYNPFKNIPSSYPPFIPEEPKSGRILTKEEIELLEKLLQKAKEFDEANGLKDCEMEEKKQKIRDLCKEWQLPPPNFP